MHSENDYKQIAAEALKKYSIKCDELVYLGKGDNATFRVSTSFSDLKYLIKIHCSTMEIITKEFIESELLWLEALASVPNLVLPTPLRNQDYELITEVRTNNEGLWRVTCYSWVNGEVLNRQPTSKETARLAVLMATLHKHSIQWDVPKSFDRPVYNSANLLSSLTKLRHNFDLMTIEQFTWLENTVQKIRSDIEKQIVTRDNWGIIHSDLHEGNYVFDRTHPRPIDFSACGYGFYLFDIAETFLHLYPENRKIFISTYNKEHQLHEIDVNLLESFFIWAIIRNFAFLSANPIEYEFLSKSIPSVIQNYCKKYLKGESFLLN
ncbi:aminoglycoside phosphotransferase [Paenibacillus ginsengarvi]|uniref:Aminoglycoside phosphotransferase n=1 Tax=Paenibacillus ginsengarvi TaxID=400777 RepID=A0A3B0BDY8_9BACL|nr:aminoglycoside phosphotransferase [Paenibacillus ginsengarvi]